MARVEFSIWDDVLVEASSLTINAGEEVSLLTSSWFDNNSAQNGVQVVLDYHALTPDVPGAPFSIGAMIEAEDANDDIYPIAYQFSPFKLMDISPKREIIMEPGISDFNAGIDDIVYPVDREVARISRQHGILPDSRFRVRVLMVDNDPTGPNAFVSVRISGAGEKFDV